MAREIKVGDIVRLSESCSNPTNIQNAKLKTHFKVKKVFEKDLLLVHLDGTI